MIWLPAAVEFMSSSPPLGASAARTAVAASVVVRRDVKSMVSEEAERETGSIQIGEVHHLVTYLVLWGDEVRTLASLWAAEAPGPTDTRGGVIASRGRCPKPPERLEWWWRRTFRLTRRGAASAPHNHVGDRHSD